MKKDLETLIEEALENIRDDREIAKELLNDTANLIANKPDDSRYLGPVAAKHIETLQRSNEQLVKLISIRQKESTKSVSLSEDDKSEIFDIINSTPTGSPN
jgi:hypothetical protein